MKDWPLRQALIPGKLKVINAPLVSGDSIIFPNLHIKLRPNKEHVKSFKKDGERFKYITRIFTKLSSEKIKAGTFCKNIYPSPLKNWSCFSKNEQI